MKKWNYVRRIVVGNEIHKIGLEEISLAVYRTKANLWYRTLGEKKVLIAFQVVEDTEVLSDGTFVSFIAVTNVMYTEVTEYKKFLVYDPFHGLLRYTNDLRDVKRFGETTEVFLVKNLPEPVVDAVAKKIKELEKIKQGVNF